MDALQAQEIMKNALGKGDIKQFLKKQLFKFTKDLLDEVVKAVDILVGLVTTYN